MSNSFPYRTLPVLVYRYFHIFLPPEWKWRRCFCILWWFIFPLVYRTLEIGTYEKSYRCLNCVFLKIDNQSNSLDIFTADLKLPSHSCNKKKNPFSKFRPLSLIHLFHGEAENFLNDPRTCSFSRPLLLYLLVRLWRHYLQELLPLIRPWWHWFLPL